MKIGVYNIINNPLPQLSLIKEIKLNNMLLDSDKKIIDIMNKHLYMDKLASEHIYALGLNYGWVPKGIIQVGVGLCNECDANLRDLAIGLLLLGSEQFICFHNHPGNCEDPSESDMILTKKYREIGELIGIKFLDHIMITQGLYVSCKEQDTEIIFGQEVSI